MSMKVNVISISIKPKGEKKIDCTNQYECEKSEIVTRIDPFLEIEFVDEEEGFVGLYPGIAESFGVKIDRTTAGSLLRICRFLHEHRDYTHKIDYALNGATITISNNNNENSCIEIIVNVHDQFVWSANMSLDSLRVVGEGLEYSLEQFEASLVGKDASDVFKAAQGLLLEKTSSTMIHPKPMTPQAISAEEWGSES